MRVIVFSNSPPGGRCRLYMRYAQAIVDHCGLTKEILFPEDNPPKKWVPAACFDNRKRVVSLADGVIVSSEAIVRVLVDLGKESWRKMPLRSSGR